MARWEHPGGKLRELGAEALTYEELLAIIISSGGRNNKAETIAREIINKFGPLDHITSSSLENLQEIKGVGKVKSTQLAAVFELVRRIIDGKSQKSSTSDKGGKAYAQKKTEVTHKEYRVLSLFSGCGGMDLGFEGDFEALEASINEKINVNWIVKKERPGWVRLRPTPFEVKFANDISPYARTAWTTYFSKRNLAPETFHSGSIVDCVKTATNGGRDVFPDNIDVILGGFPCQDFSVAGKRKGFNSHKSHLGKLLADEPTIENRGQLYIWMKNVIEIVKPKLFIAENVKGLTNLANVKEIIENDFRNTGKDGYVVPKARVLNAAEYGIPQSRERVFFFGFLKSALTKEALKTLEMDIIPPEYDPYPVPTHKLINETMPLGKNLKPAVTVRTALKGLKEPVKSTDLSQRCYSRARFMGKHCQGQIEVNLDSIGPTIRAEHHGNIEYRRLSKANSGRYNDELAQGFKERRLTVRECARLQTFPDDYAFVINGIPGSKKMRLSASEGYRLVGNAVPPLLAYHIAARLEELWNKLFKEV